MISVKIAELKARLSEHLRSVRRGETLTVLDRETPVARIVPIPARTSPLQVRSPRTATPPGRVRLPAPSKVGVDAVALLAEERSER